MSKTERTSKTKERTAQIPRTGSRTGSAFPEVPRMSESTRKIMKKVVERDSKALWELSRH